MDLKKRRTAAGLTQRELARRAGIHSMTVTQLERCPERQPKAATLLALAKALGCTAEELSGQRRSPAAIAAGLGLNPKATALVERYIREIRSGK